MLRQKAKTEAEEKDGFVEVNKVFKHDSIQIKNTLLVMLGRSNS